MIVVDSSVWIANLRGFDSDVVRKLTATATRRGSVIVGDVVLLEVLQGARDDAHANRTERDMRQFTVMSMLDADTVVRAARNYRLLRARGITVRKLVDIVIGTFCIDRGYELLHQDRDCAPMAEHLGLRIA